MLLIYNNYFYFQQLIFHHRFLNLDLNFTKNESYKCNLNYFNFIWIILPKW